MCARESSIRLFTMLADNLSDKTPQTPHARAMMHAGVAIPRRRVKLSRPSLRMRNPWSYVSCKRPMKTWDTDLTSSADHIIEKWIIPSSVRYLQKPCRDLILYLFSRESLWDGRHYINWHDRFHSYSLLTCRSNKSHHKSKPTVHLDLKSLAYCIWKRLKKNNINNVVWYRTRFAYIWLGYFQRNIWKRRMNTTKDFKDYVGLFPQL